MTDNEIALIGRLREACLLISVEARDHEENRTWEDRQQRKDVAKILRRFVDHAAKVLSSIEKPSDSVDTYNYAADDFAFDAAREDRIFGKR